MSQGEAAASAEDVHGPKGADGQPAPVAKHLSLGTQAKLFSLLLGAAVGEPQAGRVWGVLVTVDDGVTAGIGARHLNAAGVDE